MGINGDPLGVSIDIDRRRMSVTDTHIADVFLPARKPDSETVGEVSRKIRRLCAVREMINDESEKIFAREHGGTIEWEMLRALHHIIDKHVELEIWRHFPELAGKPFVVYDDWRVGPETTGAEMHDLFKTRDTVSTRSDDVRLDRTRFRLPDPAPRR